MEKGKVWKEVLHLSFFGSGFASSWLVHLVSVLSLVSFHVVIIINLLGSVVAGEENIVVHGEMVIR